MRLKFFAPVVLLVAGGLALSACSKPASAASSDNARSIAGTWTVTVHPNGQPSFQSTITYTSAGGVIEATSKPAPPGTAAMTGGIGTWTRAGDGHVSTHFLKYRFDTTGAYIGTTDVTEDELVDASGNSYTGNATTRLMDKTGKVLMSFTSTSDAVRMS
jgi:hypothetical protein